MSAPDDARGLSDAVELHKLGWKNTDDSAHQHPTDHRTQSESWVTEKGYMKVGEVGNEDGWIASDFVMEVRE